MCTACLSTYCVPPPVAVTGHIVAPLPLAQPMSESPGVGKGGDMAHGLPLSSLLRSGYS